MAGTTQGAYKTAEAQRIARELARKSAGPAQSIVAPKVKAQGDAMANRSIAQRVGKRAK